MSAPNRVAPALGDESLIQNLGKSAHDGPEWCSRCTGTVLTMNRNAAHVGAGMVLTMSRNGCSRWAGIRTHRARDDSQQKTERINGKDAVAGQVLVKFRSSLSAERTLQIKQAIDTEIDIPVGGAGARLLQSRSKTAASIVQELSKRDDLVYVEPNYIVHTDALPNDPKFSQMWGLQNTGQVFDEYHGNPGADIGVIPAWNISTGSRANVVGIVDTGIDYNHPDLAANVWSAPSSFTVQIDGQSITCAAGSHGFNVLNMTCDPMDDNHHGTHVAGTIGAVGNNGIGVTGVNQTASLMGLKFLNTLGFGTTADALNALEFAVQVKASFAQTSGANLRVLNNSWGGDGYSQAMLDQISRTRDADMLFVAAAGNDGHNLETKPAFPASYSNYGASSVITVAATNNMDALTAFGNSASNWGRFSVHLGAPGVDVLSTIPNNQYAFFSGTSMATPHVTGAAALILSRCQLNTADLKSTILNNVDAAPALKNLTITGGRLNVNRALTACGPADFLISIKPTFRIITAGAQAQYVVSVQSVHGFVGSIALSLTELPAGASASFSSPSITTEGDSTLTISTDPSVPTGTYQLNVVGTSGGVKKIGITLLDLPEYSVKDLGVPEDHLDSLAYGVNNSGQVVGYSYRTFGSNHPFLYSNGVMQDLTANGDQGVAAAINSQGHVLGTLFNGSFHGFVYKDGAMSALPAQLNGELRGINDSDQIVGWYSVNGNRRGFLYNLGANVSDLPIGFDAFALNNSAQIVGLSAVTGFPGPALFFNNTVTNIGFPNSVGGQATAINSSGQVVGWGLQEFTIGYLYNNGVFTDLGSLGNDSTPQSINSSGQIAGWAGDHTSHAFLYRNSLMANLDDLVPLDSPNYLFDARGMNDFGQIAGTSFTGQRHHAYLASPISLVPLPTHGPPSVIITNPANGTTLYDPAKLNIAAIVRGDNVSKVDFFVDGNLVGTATNYPYSIDWRNVTGDGHFRAVTATVTTQDGQTATSGPTNILIFPSYLDVPFSHGDVGSVGFAGHAVSLFGTLTINGSGADIGGAADAFHYVYQFLNGDGQIIARVATLEPTDPDAKAGVMLRETFAEDSREASTVVTAAHGIQFLRRQSVGGTTITSTGPNVVAPYWVKLVRHGDIFDAYQSSDGSNWILFGTDTINMQKKIAIGMVVTAHTNADISEATFGNISITQNNPNQAPTVSIVSPTNGAVFYNGGTVFIVAKASDADGHIAKVEFLINGQTLIATATTAPFMMMKNGCCGIQHWVARATDDQGAVTYSDEISFTTNQAAPPPQTTLSTGGQITDANDQPISGVTMNLSGASSATATTDSNGKYVFTNLTNLQNYVLTPSRAGYRFIPSSQSVFTLGGSELGAYFQAIVVKPNTIQFSAQANSVNEGDGSATVTVTRVGDVSDAAWIDYSTSDASGHQSSDYILTAGTLNFAPGEATKSFSVLLVDNAYVDGNRTVNISLSNPVGASLGTATSLLTIQDNDVSPPATNPLDNADARFFVRQHYLDFLNRLPDLAGYDYWSGQISQCGNDPLCIRDKHNDVSNAFFYEQEYQQTGAYVFRLYRAAFGNNQPWPNPDTSNPTEAKKLPDYSVFARDRAKVIGGSSLTQGQLDLAAAFVERPEFLAKYPLTMVGSSFINAVLQTIRNDTGVDLTGQLTDFNTLWAQGGRAAVMYRLADDNIQSNPIYNRPFIDAEYNRGFVATQYFGYLRRNPEIPGFLFWLNQVNSAALRDVPKQHAMVCSFITSAEYEQRFSPIVTHTNSDCPR